MANNTSASHKRVQALTEGAVMVAMAQILDLMPLYRMPWGGSLKLSMLPIIIYCVRWGFAPGMIVGLANALLQGIFAGGVAIGWESLLGDYIVAYAVLGLAGLFRGKYYVAALVGCGARFLVHYVVGATIWGEYMPETFFNMTMTTPWFYSALYNGAYMVPCTLAVLLVGFLLMKTPAKKYLLGQDL